MEREKHCVVCGKIFLTEEATKCCSESCRQKRIKEKRRNNPRRAEQMRNARARMRPAMKKINKLKVHLNLATNAETILYLFYYYIRREKEDRKKISIKNSMEGGE